MMGIARGSEKAASTMLTPFPNTFLYLTLLCFVAIYIRVLGVGAYYYSSDELQHVDIIMGPTLADVLQFSRFETHPPLGYILRHYWILLSDAPWFTRSFSLIFGIALIPIYYCIGRTLNSRFTGICCATLVAFSYGCIIQSYIVRDYTIFLFFLSIGFYFFLRWSKTQKFIHLFTYGALCALSCLTRFSGIFAVSAIFVYELLYIRSRGVFSYQQMPWIITNSLIFIVAVFAYYFWKDTLNNSLTFYSAGGWKLLSGALSYPVGVLFYIYPSRTLVILTLLILPFVRKLNNSDLNSLCILATIALCIGAALVGTAGLFNADQIPVYARI